MKEFDCVMSFCVTEMVIIYNSVHKYIIILVISDSIQLRNMLFNTDARCTFLTMNSFSIKDLGIKIHDSYMVATAECDNFTDIIEEVNFLIKNIIVNVNNS